MNAPLSGTKIRELVNCASHWLYCAGLTNTRRLEGSVLHSINYYKELFNDFASGYQICRHCVMELFALMITDELIKSEFTDKFLKSYEFDSVIY